jgi:hypothetical protein
MPPLFPLQGSGGSGAHQSLVLEGKKGRRHISQVAKLIKQSGLN